MVFRFDDLFLRVLDLTKSGTLVILAVLLLRLFLRKAPKICSYVLWAVVLFRLLCPFSLEVSGSCSQIKSANRASTAPSLYSSI